MLRRVILALAFCLAWSAGQRADAAIAEDTGVAAIGHTETGAATSVTVALNTAGTDRLLILQISNQNNSTLLSPTTVSTVTDDTGTTNAWVKLLGGAAVNDGKVTVGQNAEVWWTCAPSTVSSKTITVTFAGAILDAAQATVIGYTGQGCSTANYEIANTSITELASGNSFTQTITSSSSTAGVAYFGTSASNNGPPSNRCGSTVNTYDYGGTTTGVGFLARAEAGKFVTTGFSGWLTGFCTADAGSTPATAGSTGGWFALVTLCNPCTGAGGATAGGLLLLGFGAN